MKVYFASILDIQGKEIMNLEFTASAKHSAFLANEFIKHCPPAQGFTIHKMYVDATTVARLLNSKR